MTEQIQSAAARLRAERAKSAWITLHDADPQDAEVIAFAFLSRMETRAPSCDPFWFTTGEALIWADAAALHQVAAYFTASAARLSKSTLCLTVRKRLAWRLWRSLPKRDRAEFVDTAQRFEGRR